MAPQSTKSFSQLSTPTARTRDMSARVLNVASSSNSKRKCAERSPKSTELAAEGNSESGTETAVNNVETGATLEVNTVFSGGRRKRPRKVLATQG